MKFRFTPAKGNDMGFTPDDIDDFECAKQRVVNLLDDWPWLANSINENKLTWSEIFDLVAKHM